MIESSQILPRLGRVTRLASGSGLVCQHLPHALLELPLVRIGVATGAAQLSPVIDHRRLRLELRRLFVAVGTRNRYVSSGENEVRFLMFSQCKSGRLVSLQVVAAVTGVEVGRRGKLRRVTI